MTDINTINTSEIICPHCGHEHLDSWEIDLSYGPGMECDGCGKPFIVFRDEIVYYRSFKPGDAGTSQ